MSGIFDSNAGRPAAAPPPRRTPSRRPRALLPTLGVVVALVIVFSVFVEIWTERLWFSSLGYGVVFNKVLFTRVALFVIFGLLLAAAAVGNAYLAHRMRPILHSDGYRNPTVERYQDTIDPIRHWVLIGLGAVMFLFGGASASGQWRSYLMWRNGGEFGQVDQNFSRDIGFFVFDYPWFRFLIGFAFTVVVISLIAAAVTHYLYGGIRLGARRDRVMSGAQIQLSVLMGVFMLAKAVAYWLDRYGLAITDGQLFTGISYTDANAVLPAKNILMFIAVICALLFFGNVIRPGWMLPVLGFGLLILSAILIGGIWPAIVQRFEVRPSEPDKEAPYIAKNIQSTRDAFGINDVKFVNYPGVTNESPEQLQDRAEGLPGVRLIDPKLVAPTFTQLQQQRGFYDFPEVLDVDRYQLEDGEPPQDVVLAARELDLNGLEASQRNWAVDHTVYTHGYGVVAAYGDQRNSEGEPVFAQQNLPSTGVLGKFEQRVYYGEMEPDYSIVGQPEGAEAVELNIPSVGETGASDLRSTYTGDGGVAIGSMFNQALYATKFWDSSILLSGRVNSESTIIYDRNPRDMVEKVAPWLTVDSDPYPAVVDGRLLWVVDGFTTTANYPMSEQIDVEDATSDSLTEQTAVASQQSNDINYIRNSVKATVDAYDGTVSLYEWDEQDPLLQAWMGAFPDVVQPRSAISDELMAHLRYPEDLFKVQRELLSTYHVDSPETFYGGSERWKVPEDPQNDAYAQPPFFLTVKLPEGEPEFSLTSVFVPQSRENLASFVSVNADAASDTYGQMTVLELPSDNAVSGPGQVANAMSNDPTVSGELLKYKQNDITPQMGNLLTLPIGGELLYVQPVYTSRGVGTGSYPILQFVVVAVGNEVGIGTSFEGAFANALGLEEPTTGEGPVTPPPDPGGGGTGTDPPPTEPGDETAEEKMTRYLEEAKAAFDEAQTALEEGRLGDYQKANNQGLRWLELALELRGQAGLPEGTPPATTGPAGDEQSEPSTSDPTPAGG
ncbi:MAG: INTEGRAL MEMBRANE PROTEIN (Rhomboid family) [uncultured Nocardioidaceae bacterium]|uniref:UPF0182 protein AVDCRST_MAG21-1164 n=1 Tax=uncultured Nocardioidaceae bacterium TaxID=253824 RepID=A0A6J4N1V2_9ACTN|nr:MAG: INTEGRAL MEMBRANE PROTEIN (Rhomboid family) [uncultured Nocardioidaceae bacterium]